MKGKSVENGSLSSNVPRKGLNDITNFQEQPKAVTQDAKLLLQPASLRSQDYINKLQQENMMLMKVLADRNKVIESSAIELQKLKISLGKYQKQNLQLAQANSQMLSELNSGKDRLKILQHEMGCRTALLKVIESEALLHGLKEVTNKHAKAGESLQEDGDCKPCNTNRCGKASESFKEADGENKPCNMNGRPQSKSIRPSNIEPVEAKEGTNSKRVCLRRQSARLKAQEPETTKDVFEVDNRVSSPCGDKLHQSGLISSDSLVRKELYEGCMTTTNEPVKAKEGVNKKRVCLRRQSERFIALEPESAKDVIEVDNTNFPVSSPCNDRVHKSGLISSGSSVKKELYEGCMTTTTEAQELRRVSTGRPLRRAAEKVQSYKEMKLNVKMRREL